MVIRDLYRLLAQYWLDIKGYRRRLALGILSLAFAMMLLLLSLLRVVMATHPAQRPRYCGPQICLRPCGGHNGGEAQQPLRSFGIASHSVPCLPRLSKLLAYVGARPSPVGSPFPNLVVPANSVACSTPASGLDAQNTSTAEHVWIYWNCCYC
jgi:hypothetical protein